MPTSESSANGNLLATLRLGFTSLAHLPGELVELTLEPPQLEPDDQHVDEHDEEDHAVRGGDVLLGRGDRDIHERSSRSARSRACISFPATYLLKSIASYVQNTDNYV